MVSISDLYEPRTKAYYKAVKWLNTYAKHERVRKGRKTYWHEDDIAALQTREQPTKWPSLIPELFAEPTTIYDALDMLAERGAFMEVSAIRTAVYKYERKGMLKKAGKVKDLSLSNPPTLWVAVRD